MQSSSLWLAWALKKPHAPVSRNVAVLDKKADFPASSPETNAYADFLALGRGHVNIVYETYYLIHNINWHAFGNEKIHSGILPAMQNDLILKLPEPVRRKRGGGMFFSHGNDISRQGSALWAR